MIEILKDIIIIWMAMIITLAFICILVAMPVLLIIYTGRMGEWQIIVSALWITFWLSFAIAVTKDK